MKKKKLEFNQPLRLDLACGSNKQPGFTGVDVRDVEGVDIVHDLEKFPWPFEDESVGLAIASHYIEHLKPWLSIAFMDEVWRILIPGGTFCASTPYGGSRTFLASATRKSIGEY